VRSAFLAVPALHLVTDIYIRPLAILNLCLLALVRSLPLEASALFWGELGVHPVSLTDNPRNPQSNVVQLCMLLAKLRNRFMDGVRNFVHDVQGFETLDSRHVEKLVSLMAQCHPIPNELIPYFVALAVECFKTLLRCWISHVMQYGDSPIEEYLQLTSSKLKYSSQFAHWLC
jgi:hypothetical protein